MADTTKIAWASSTASPWHGCTHGVYTDADGNEHEHPGCSNCYAEKGSKRSPGILGVWGTEGTRVMSASFRERCLRWNRLAEKEVVRRSVFPSICDPFEDWHGPIFNAKGEKLYYTTDDYRFIGPDDVSQGFAYNHVSVTMSDLRRDLFATIDECPWLDFLLLTKRPGNVRGMWPHKRGCGCGHCGDMTVSQSRRGFQSVQCRGNVAIITSISDQATADALLPELLACRDLVPTLGVSAEPLLGEIDLDAVHIQADPGFFGSPLRWHHRGKYHADEGIRYPTLDWVIIGVESNGKKIGRLPGGTEAGYWRAAKSLVEQCRAASVPCFHKQGPVNGRVSHEPSEWPEWARVQQFPVKGSVTT